MFWPEIGTAIICRPTIEVAANAIIKIMLKKILDRLKHLSKKQRITASIIGAVVIALIVVQLLPPERSVAAYCKEYKKQLALFPHGKDQYGAGIFTSETNDPGHFASAYAALERVAPNDIRQDVRTLHAVFDTIDKNPEQTLSASLSGLGAESSVKDWTANHCTE